MEEAWGWVPLNLRRKSQFGVTNNLLKLLFTLSLKYDSYVHSKKY